MPLPNRVRTQEHGARSIVWGAKKWESSPYLGLEAKPTLEEAKALVQVPEADGFACWNGHEFEVVKGYVEVGDFVITPYWNQSHVDPEAFEYHMVMYFPVDPRIREQDVAGATVAHPNQTNDGWLFGHCDEDWMFDHEMRLRAAAESVFGGAHRNSFLGVNLGMRLLLNSDTEQNRAAADRSRAHAQVLDTFHSDVVKAILHEARSHHIGYFQQNPHEGHVLAPIERAIRLVVSRWDSTPEGVANHKLIRKAVARALNTVQHRHGYETRWDQAARLEAERKAAEEAAAGDDGSGE